MSKNIKKYLGVDWGEARIGLALGDSETAVAVPFKTVGGLGELLKVAAEEGVDKIILGEPVSLSGRAAGPDGDFGVFLRDLKSRTAAPIELADERLTSRAARTLVRPAGRSGKNHAVAAMLILQSYFDRRPAVKK